MANSVYLEVKIYGGGDIATACVDAVTLARRIGVDVWFEFNGVRCLAGPDTEASELAEKQQKAQMDGQRYA